MKRSKFNDSQIVDTVKRSGLLRGSRYLPRVGHHHGDVLQMAGQVRWHGCVHDVAHERA